MPLCVCVVCVCAVLCVCVRACMCACVLRTVFMVKILRFTNTSIIIIYHYLTVVEFFSLSNGV